MLLLTTQELKEDKIKYLEARYCSVRNLVSVWLDKEKDNSEPLNFCMYQPAKENTGPSGTIWKMGNATCPRPS